jgi:hypothetical protein
VVVSLNEDSYVFVMEKQYVYCAVGSEFLNFICLNVSPCHSSRDWSPTITASTQFNPSSFGVRFVVDEVALGQDIL